MSPVTAVGQVFDAIQQARAGASAFCTNLFPVQEKLQGWIDHGELLVERRAGSVFFFRKDDGFWHLYFCATDVPTLGVEMGALSSLKTELVVLDLVGKERTLDGVLNAAESAGFRRYSRLFRLARTGEAGQPQPGSGDAPVLRANHGDIPAILELLQGSFDRYADQLPRAYELEEAIGARQVLAIKVDGVLAALLFFETQGLTSTVRYWVVAERFQSRRLGAVLMRHYFASHLAVRRFILWVTATNENALRKYQHYGYAPDGLVDHVLVNSMIRS